MPRTPGDRSEDRPSSLREHLVMGIFMAAAFTAMAVLVVVVQAVLRLTGINNSATPSAGELIGLTLAATVAYALAGLSGAVAVWLLRGLRRRLVGWIVTGFVVAFLAYGSIGLLSAVLFSATGVNLLEYTTPAATWRALPVDSLGLGLAVGVPGGIWFWWKRPWG